MTLCSHCNLDFMNFILTYRNIFCSLWNIFCSWFDAKNNNNIKAYFRTFEYSSWSKSLVFILLGLFRFYTIDHQVISRVHRQNVRFSMVYRINRGKPHQFHGRNCIFVIIWSLITKSCSNHASLQWLSRGWVNNFHLFNVQNKLSIYKVTFSKKLKTA